ncbi:MAG: hypothetical protein QXZ70_07645 [Candidatus Bathyarchaeia archaeon]
MRKSTTPSPVGRQGVPVKLEKLRIKNARRQIFRERVLKIPQLAYDVEDLNDGRKIVITKPGAKSADDIMVWVYEGEGGAHWRPSHKQLYDDLKGKIMSDKEKGLLVLEALERVYNGEDPEDVLSSQKGLGIGLPGLPVDLILKAYKWIWVQEDCNYPPPKYLGREMSMNELIKLKTKA